MKLTKTSAHAALALIFLAEQSDSQPTQARQVAEHLGVPTDSALKVLQTLVRQRLLSSQLGRSGGYRLETPPEQLTLLNVVEAVEGPVGAEVPRLGSGNSLEDVVGRIRSAWESCTHSLRQSLSDVTLADLLDPQKRSMAELFETDSTPPQALAG